MYYDKNEIMLSNGRGAGVLFGHKPTFAELFSNPPLYYFGSQIHVQEIMTINSEILNADLVDVDKRWFNERYYLGTWDSDSIITNGLDLEHSGRIMALQQKVIRYSSYTIVANPQRRRSIEFGMTINQCNFELQEVSVPLGQATIKASQPTRNTGLFNTVGYKEPASLGDTEYNSFFTNPGFYAYEGVLIRSIERRISIINDIYVDDPAWVPVLCNLGEPDCDQEFTNYFNGLKAEEAAYIASNPGSLVPPEFNHHELSSGACRVYEIEIVQTFTCGDGQTRTYYFCGGGA
jgi:hypothetical protein